MKGVKEYEILNFDINNIKLIKEIVNFFCEIINNLKIKIFYETTGFYETVDRKEFNKRLEEYSKEYTGLDEIIIEQNSNQVMGIIFHEHFCIFKIDDNLKKDLEKKFGIKLIIYKKNENIKKK